MNHPKQGFTLIELMIVLAVIGILTAIAYPTYQNHMIDSRRSDGQAALLNMSSLMESYFTENNTYVGANPTTLGITNASQQGYYTLSVTTATATAFTLSAAPAGVQTADTTCGTLTITNTNIKGPNPSTCWN
ncbi:MAG: type IV pilin protein [Proteobacteria bacterium]|nr:type IV pilin protein [Pseudomonadota bacterium]